MFGFLGMYLFRLSLVGFVYCRFGLEGGYV